MPVGAWVGSTMSERHQDWMRQAHLDFDHARLAAREGHLEWAVLAAQQAAEKACRAAHMSLGGDAWGRRRDQPRAGWSVARGRRFSLRRGYGQQPPLPGPPMRKW